MLQRVHDFGNRHGTSFPAGSPGAQAFEAVGAALRQLAERVTPADICRKEPEAAEGYGP